MPVRTLTFDTVREDGNYECLCGYIAYESSGLAGHMGGCRLWRAFRRADAQEGMNVLRALLRNRLAEGERRGRFQCTRPHRSQPSWAAELPTINRDARQQERRRGWQIGYGAGYADGFGNRPERLEAPANVTEY